MPEWASLQVFLTRIYRTTRKCFELPKKWSENRKVFIRNLFILLFWLYHIVSLTRLKFLSVPESGPLKWRRTDMFTFPRERGMNNLRRERCLIKFDEEKSVLTFYRRQSVFEGCYQLRYRCLCIPRHTRCTDNQASACVCIQFVFVWNDDCVVIESMYMSQWKKQKTKNKKKTVSQDGGFVKGCWEYILEYSNPSFDSHCTFSRQVNV